LKSQDLTLLQDRCQRAATHNQTVLAAMAARWPNDFAQWISILTQTLTNPQAIEPIQCQI
jgi:hypothetical protein